MLEKVEGYEKIALISWTNQKVTCLQAFSSGWIWPANCYQYYFEQVEQLMSTLSMFDWYKSIYNVVGSCMMSWFMKFEWLAYGDESLLCTLNVCSTASSNFFLLLLHSKAWEKSLLWGIAVVLFSWSTSPSM